MEVFCEKRKELWVENDLFASTRILDISKYLISATILKEADIWIMFICSKGLFEINIADPQGLGCQIMTFGINISSGTINCINLIHQQIISIKSTAKIRLFRRFKKKVYSMYIKNGEISVFWR
jgi:hypothetical protein